VRACRSQCRNVWPLLSETPPEEDHPAVAAALRLIGLMGSSAFAGSAPPAEESDKFEWLTNTLSMVIPAVDSGGSLLVYFLAQQHTL